MTNPARMHELTDDIAANRVPGGSAFARAAAELITLRVAALPTDATAEDVTRTVTEASRWAASTKPSMAVVRNVADLAQTIAGEGHSEEPADLRAAIENAMTKYIDHSNAAVDALAGYAGDVIYDGATVLIHSYSASLRTVLLAAASAGIRYRLLVTESRPYRESRRLIEAVADWPVDIFLYSDAAVCIAAESADVAIVGADSVFTDGSFANKTGSLPLAMACRDIGVPLFVATELAKVYFGDSDDIEMELRPASEMSEGWSLIESGRVQVWNQFFERVDASYVHRYVTEDGLLAAGEIRPAAARAWAELGATGTGPATAARGALPVESA